MHELKSVFDGVSVGAGVAALLGGVLPHVLTILSVVWMVIRIYETPTIQKMLGKNKELPHDQQPKP